jgi:hypothetical protein
VPSQALTVPPEVWVPVRCVGDFTHRKLVAFQGAAFWPVIE